MNSFENLADIFGTDMKQWWLPVRPEFYPHQEYILSTITH